MVTVSIMYPNQSGKRFDYDYYLGKHIPWTLEVVSSHPDFRNMSVVRGVSMADPRAELAYVAACHIIFATREGFLESFMPHAKELAADVVNYTDIEPITQFNNIEVFEGKK